MEWSITRPSDSASWSLRIRFLRTIKNAEGRDRLINWKIGYTNDAPFSGGTGKYPYFPLYGSACYTFTGLCRHKICTTLGRWNEFWLRFPNVRNLTQGIGLWWWRSNLLWQMYLILDINNSHDALYSASTISACSQKYRAHANIIYSYSQSRNLLCRLKTSGVDQPSEMPDATAWKVPSRRSKLPGLRRKCGRLVLDYCGVYIVEWPVRALGMQQRSLLGLERLVVTCDVGLGDWKRRIDRLHSDGPDYQVNYNCRH